MKKGTLLPFFTPTSAKKATPVLIKSNQKSSSTQFKIQPSMKCPDIFSPIIACLPNTSQDPADTKVTPIKSTKSSTKIRSRDADSLNEMFQSFQKRLKSNAEAEAAQLDPILAKKVTVKTDEIKGSLTFDNIKMKTQFTGMISNGQENTDKSITLTQAIEELRQPQKAIRKSSVGFMSSTCRDLLRPTEIQELEEQIENLQLIQPKEKIDLAKLVSKETLDIINRVRAKHNKAGSSSNANTKLSELSVETRNIIKLVKSKSMRMTQNPRSAENVIANYSKAITAVDLLNTDKDTKNPKTILRSASMREKYEELLNGNRDFILPVSYKRLLQAFEKLDLILNSLLGSTRSFSFELIMEKMRTEYNRILTYTQLAQMMFVRPTAYKVAWEKTDRSKEEFELFMGFPNDENGDVRVLTASRLEERIQAFKERLLQITKKHHIEFLKTRSQEEREKDYDKLKCWHGSFDVNSCPAIPEEKLVQLPVNEKSGSQSYEIESSGLKSLIKQKDNQKKYIVSKFFSCHQNQIQEISNKILDTVEKKRKSLVFKDQEMGVDKIKSFSEEEIRQLEKLARSLDEYYFLRSTQSMFFVSVVDRISKEYQNNLSEMQADIRQCIEDLASANPEWLAIFEANGFKILKMKKRLNLEELVEKLRE